MDNIIKISDPANDESKNTELIKISEDILFDTSFDIKQKNTISMPITQLATLGAGFAAFIPSFRTITQTNNINVQGLYKLANAGIGDALKATKENNIFWGAIKTESGKSKMAKLQSVNSVAESSQTLMPINPATIMIAVALFSIEKQLTEISETQKKILNFLEIEKEAEIEADVEILFDLLSKYKFNWDNEQFVSGNYNQTLNILRNARKHVDSFQKIIYNETDSNKLIIAKSKVKSNLENLIKKFKYYRLSVFTYAMASFLEIMLSGNFQEEYIEKIITEIEDVSIKYRDNYSRCSFYLEEQIKSAFGNNIVKSIGKASNKVGKFIGNIPVVKEGPVDEILQKKGTHLENNAKEKEHNIIETFAEVSNPGISVFVSKMKDIIQIYNHTESIYFDDKKLYLVAG